MSTEADRSQVLTAQQEFWNSFSDAYEEINTKISIQGSTVLHSRMELSSDVSNILEIACAGGIGTKDLLRCLNSNQSVLATDHSPAMISKAKSALSSFPNVKVSQADAMDLNSINSSSIDRYVSSLCLQLVPNPDKMLCEAHRVLSPKGIAGFTVWGSEENSGVLKIWNETVTELYGKKASSTHGHFEFSSDVGQMKNRVLAAGFKSVSVWPVLCVVETRDAVKYVQSQLPQMFKPSTLEEEASSDQKKINEIFFQKTTEWLNRGYPIGLEVYVILAYK